MDIVNYILSNKIKKYVDDSVGNVSDEKITEAVNTYLDENPPVTGATTEQVTQIQNNADNISDIQSKLSVTDEEADNYLFGDTE